MLEPSLTQSVFLIQSIKVSAISLQDAPMFQAASSALSTSEHNFLSDDTHSISLDVVCCCVILQLSQITAALEHADCC